MFSSRLYQRSVFYSVAFIGYYWLFMISQPSIIAAMPAIYYPKLLIISIFFPLLLVTIAYLFIQLIFPKKVQTYVFSFIPAGILTYLIYIFIDKLCYSKFAKNSLDLTSGYKIIFLLGLLLLFIFIYYKQEKKIEKNPSQVFKYLTQYFVFGIFVASISMFSYYLLFQKKYELNVVKTNHFNPVNILIVSIDGAEDDLMSVYGYKKDTTPFLKSIKNEFFIADNFYTNNCCTFGSLTSMYTGKTPIETKVTDIGKHLIGKDRYEHLPGVLKKIGYNTIQSTISLNGESTYMGLLDGFNEINYRKDNYFIHWSYFKTLIYGAFFYERVAFFQQIYFEEFLPRFLFFIKDKSYINPYNELISLAKTDPLFDDNKTKHIADFFKNKAKTDPFFVHLHLMETHSINPVSYEKGMIESDANIKTLYYALKNNLLLDKTILIVTSDHNQGWKTLKPIPLLVRFPGLAHAGEHVSKNIQMIDIAPTLFDYIGLNSPYLLKGMSFLKPELIKENRPIYSLESLKRQLDVHAILTDKGGLGVNKIKVQVCNEYLLEDLDDKGKVVKMELFHGYEIIPSCVKKT